MSAKGPVIMPRQQQNLAPSPAGSAPSPSASVGKGSPPSSVSSGKDSGEKEEGSMAPGPARIITSKEWVLPPRPKPGRKPSVDTPASKRKAQNRAAQRAFRERRATRVQELEQKLLEVEKEKEIKEMGLVNTINKLKIENQYLVKTVEQLKGDIDSLKGTYGNPNNRTVAASSPGSYSAISQYRSSYSNNSSTQVVASPSSSSYSVQQISPAPSADSPPIFTAISSSKTNNTVTPVSNDNTPGKNANTNNNNFDCGVCVKEECLCETVGLKDPEPKKILDETLKEFRPMPAVSLNSRRKRSNPDSSENEIDFTSQFATKKMPDLKKLKKKPTETLIESAKTEMPEKFDESSPVENCGFCSDDSPCVCREAAKEAAKLNESLNAENEAIEDNTSLPPLQINNNAMRKSSLPVMHPGPSVEIREITNLTPGAVPTVVTPTTRSSGSVVTSEREKESPKASETPKKSGGCTGNPGTCEQCQKDPLSTLFCTTVANKEKEDSSSKSETSGSASENEPSSRPDLTRSSSRTSLPSLSITKSSTPNPTDMYIPCADAYRTLSRHKKFNSVDFSTLVGKLTTRGMQVEVQSVANVLRELDRRLYN
ncbi:Piso0_000627 [Millerozyma farinosa CBS 7064]|uniref:Piso0_000627 protein n=1 Tax=Pichia sorbitophila (strain ATCC MYA-4447 / BCRC 22081 / CBS 7064 / NBRC 10061 / NRRL Y-12695) TaxID=559304 RepID=G8YPL8_PICSO|nr:Piso0_000627 [Millerozyma farinosa CBS 7064]